VCIALLSAFSADASFTNTYLPAANQINLPIPSAGTGGSGNLSADRTVSQITVNKSPSGALVSKVIVNLNINHTSDRDLVITLVNPDGVTNVLVRNILGQNFANTTFDDAGAVPISQGTSPYEGIFKPQVPLSVLNGGIANGTWTLQIEDQSSGDIGTLVNWSLSIISDRPQITINDTAPLEGNLGVANAAFTVRLSPPSPLPVSVRYATTNGTAVSPTDYVATNGTLLFNPNDTVATILVPIKGNSTPEANKTFFVNLSSPTNADIAIGQGRATILNDDPALTNKFTAGVGQTNLFLPPVGTGGSGDFAQDTTVSKIFVSGYARTQVVAAVQVTATINHTDVGDLVASLVAPNGAFVPLFTRVAEGSANFSGTVFDDQAATPVELGSGPFTGSYRPQESLSRLLSISPNGTWTLQITDAASSDSGKLVGWSLNIVTITVPTLNVSYASGNAVLSWSTNFIGYNPDYTSGLNANPWTAVGVAPVASSGNFFVSIPGTNGARFFRLRNP
jgi:subtilisin-like proprotein convertase family protein